MRPLNYATFLPGGGGGALGVALGAEAFRTTMQASLTLQLHPKGQQQSHIHGSRTLCKRTAGQCTCGALGVRVQRA